MELNIINLFPNILNMYGDIGNLKVIEKRCNWRKINTNIIDFSKENQDEFKLDEIDMIIIGAGSSSSQQNVANKLNGYRKKLEEFIEDEGVILAISGSYYLFGNSYNQLNCLDIFDTDTILKEKTLKSNILLHNDLNLNPITIVGFENHKEQIFHKYDFLGTVKYGFGNNDVDKHEGLVYKNFIGTNIFGPLLSRNPHLADKLILEAMKRKYGIDSLEHLDNQLEIKGHNKMVERLKYG